MTDRNKLARHHRVLRRGGLSPPGTGMDFESVYLRCLSGPSDGSHRGRRTTGPSGQCSRGWRTSETFVAFSADSLDPKFGLGFGLGCVRYFNSKLHGKHRFPWQKATLLRQDRLGNTLCTFNHALRENQY